LVFDSFTKVAQTMSPGSRGRLVILSGPSCVGKSPLFACLGKFYPELRKQLHKLVLINSRDPRPGEIDGVDFHFRTRAQVEVLRNDQRYVVLEARTDLQALDIEELESLLRQGEALFEGNLYVARALQIHPRLANVHRLSIFLSPLSKEEIEYLRMPERNVSLHELVTDIMRRKLLRRTRRQKGELSAADLENIETRASSAYRELQMAWHFQYVIPNHDGEDSENWDALYYPIGDARKTLLAFVGLLQGSVQPGVEKWEESLLHLKS
jgi:guanylate kinase